MKSGIYQIYNKVNDKRYIGQAVDISKRLKNHIHELRNNKHINVFLQKDFNEYGEESLVFEPLKIIDEEFLNVMEKYFIDKYNTTNNGYNISSGNRTLKKNFKKRLELEKLESEFEKLNEFELKINKNDLLLYQFQLHFDAMIDNYIEENSIDDIDMNYYDYLEGLSSCHYVEWLLKYNQRYEKIIIDYLRKFDDIAEFKVDGNFYDSGIYYDFTQKCPYYLLNYKFKNKNDEEIQSKKMLIKFIQKDC